MKNNKKKIFNTEQERVLSALFSSLAGRERLATGLGHSFGDDRDTYKAFGYPKEATLTFQMFWNLFKRGDIAARIINAPVEASWRLLPTIEEIGNETTKKTEFVETWADLVRDHNIFHYIARADKASGIGRFGVLFLGFDDGKEPREEVSGKNNLSYLRPYKEDNICIHEWETNVKNERFGLPIMYKLTNFSSGTLQKNVEVLAHHSRVLHLAEGLLEDDIEGIPRLEVVYNRLLDLEKVAGSTGEMFYRGAYHGLAFILDKEAGDISGTTEETALEERIEKFVKSLAPQVSNPVPAFEVLISLLAGATGQPKRILIGSERGELGSSQDEIAWAKKVDERRKNYCEPFILRALIGKLIFAGVIVEPKNGYEVNWPDMIIPTDTERATVAKTRTEALAAYSNAVGADMIIPPEVFLEEFLEFDKEKIEMITKMTNDELLKENEDAEADATIREGLKKEIEAELKREADENLSR